MSLVVLFNFFLFKQCLSTKIITWVGEEEKDSSSEISSSNNNNYEKLNNDNNIIKLINSQRTASSLTKSEVQQQATPDTVMIAQELLESQWDYVTEIVFILFLAVLSIPANIFLFVVYTRKFRRFKRMKHFNLRYASIANSFHAYLVEICSFDTINVIYLILDSTFHMLYRLKKSHYESVFDISNFACKFFIYILRISGAMSNYLVFLLSLNR